MAGVWGHSGPEGSKSRKKLSSRWGSGVTSVTERTGETMRVFDQSRRYVGEKRK